MKNLTTKTKVAIVAGALVANTLFGLYNLKVTARVKTLSKREKGIILCLSALDTGVGVIHLLVNRRIGAYKKTPVEFAEDITNDETIAADVQS
jgi:hypothetical protein